MKKICIVSGVLAILLSGSGCGDNGKSKNQGDGGSVTDSKVATASLSMKQLMDGCIRASACGIMTYPYLGNCIDAYFDLYRSQGLAPIYDRLYTCVNAAKGDCDAIAKCFKRGAACDKDTKPTCNGTIAVSCDLIDQRIFELDCAHAGLKCVVPTGQVSSAMCTTGSCDTTFKSSCQGSKWLTCSNGVIETTECAIKDMGCGYYGWKTKTHGCSGNSSKSCRNYGKWVFKAFCESSTAVTCQHGMEHREDCSKNTGRKSACNEGSCRAAGTQCASSINRCAGGKLESCLDGNWKQFDCAALGLGPCKPGATLGANCSKPPI